LALLIIVVFLGGRFESKSVEKFVTEKGKEEEDISVRASASTQRNNLSGELEALAGLTQLPETSGPAGKSISPMVSQG
jgi:hypothetical protein